MATGEFKVGHRADRSLPGVGKDFGTLRKGIAPLPEMFGVLSPRAEAIHPPIAGLLQSVTNEMRLSITSRNAHTMLLSAQRFSPNARRLPHHLNADKR